MGYMFLIKYDLDCFTLTLKLKCLNIFKCDIKNK